ncbi:hypothetical protein ANCCAN_16697 [Ancylostoma caninum]|uniref:Uncharacterized protein n=1 Tax=Ancylostoma caninum TaxID=29170 RepID=A0A368FYX9_ANCCA|nr:hypothetical protein ANCCAN_16697 [Ancylostoma caninum]
MMTLDEAELERRNVTKGARTKILQSIQKLYSRSADLRTMHERLSMSHPQRCLRCAIATLRQMIATPLIPYTPSPGESSDSVDGFVCISYISDQNVPGLIFNVLRDVQQAVFISGRQPLDLEYEYLLMLFTVFDRLCNNEAFTAAQKQRVHQWKRLARKAIRPADVRRQRIGLPHSGKCELCHYKDLSHRENGKVNSKQNSGSSERISYHHNQQPRLADILVNNPFLPPRDWSQVVRNPMITPGSMPQRVPDQFVRQWPSILPLDAGRQTNVHMRNRPRPVLTQSMSLWDSLSATCPIAEKGGDTTSGYCSSTSERSSGAGSPRACGVGQTLYDRVCREVAALQLSI